MASPTRFTPDMVAAYIRSGAWMRLTTLELLERHAVSVPDHPALVDSRVRLTWREVRAAVEAIAAQFAALDLARDTPVVVQLPNSAENCLIQLALKMVGLLGAYVPIVWRRGEIAKVLERLGPGALVVPPRFRGYDLLAMGRDLRREFPGLGVVVVGGPPGGAADATRLTFPAGDEPASSAAAAAGRSYGPFEVTKLAVTSGSTGAPKIVEMTEQQQLLWGQGMVQRLRLTRDDSIGCFVPLAGGPGHSAWDTWLVTGAKLVLSDGFAPETVLPLIEGERIALLTTAPAVLARLMDSPALERYDLGSLRVVRTGSAHLSSSLAADAEKRLRCVVVNAGGATETSSFGQVSVDDPVEIRHGSSLGKVFPGVEAIVVDEAERPLPPRTAGELRVRGPATGSGYYRDPAATRQAWGALGPDGWFRTGDIATIDEAGYIALVGRTKDMINRGGMKVYPLELETVLADHPKILETAVVAIPDRTLGEVPCLCVIPRQGTRVTLDEVVDFLRARSLARYKFPARVVILADFPRGATMRIDRQRLAQRILAQLDDAEAAEPPGEAC